MNKAHFKKKMVEKRKNDGNSSKKSYSINFKVVLAAFTSADDYTAIKEHIFN